MALRLSLVTICVFVALINVRHVEGAYGLSPYWTAEKMDEIWADPVEVELGKACILGHGPSCTPEMQELSDIWPEVYFTACAACDKRERDVFRAAARNSYYMDPIFFNAAIDQIDYDRVSLDAWLDFAFSEY